MKDLIIKGRNSSSFTYGHFNDLPATPKGRYVGKVC